jgi:hypothetical protein
MKITSIYPIAILLSLLVASEVAATDERRLKSFQRELEVVPNFLKDQAIDLVSIVEKATIIRGKLHGKAMMSRSLTNAVTDLIFLPGSDMQYDETPLVNTQVIGATTDKHVDSYLVPDGERRLVENDKRVAFVFLNTNPNAHFIHDNVSVPVVEGTLVHFNGAVPHQTIVNAGVVRLLGPIYSDNFAATLGKPVLNDGAPSESPSLSTAPSDAPSESPSLSTAPSDAPSMLRAAVQLNPVKGLSLLERLQRSLRLQKRLRQESRERESPRILLMTAAQEIRLVRMKFHLMPPCSCP